MRISGSLLIVCLGLGLAHAQPQQKEADRLFAEGRELLTVKNDPQAACEKFDAAIKLDPTATGTMLNLGLCYENLGKYASSIKWFRKAQTAAAENDLAAYEDAAKEHTTAIADKVPTLNIQVTGSTEAELRIDGEKILDTDYARVEVDPGTHELTGRAPGMRDVRQAITIAEGEDQVIALTFEPPVFVDRGAGRRRTAYILAGAGVVLYGATLGYSLWLQGKLEDHKNDVDTSDFDGYDSQLKYGATGLFIGGTAAVVTAAVLYFTAPGLEELPAGTAFAPVVTGDQLGLAFAGRF